MDIRLMNGFQPQHYSDLPECVPHSDLPETTAQHPLHEGLQPEQAEKEHCSSTHHRLDHEEKETFRNLQNVNNARTSQGTSRKRRCGLAPGAFWSLVAAIAVVIIVAAVAGGVAGSESQRDDNTAPADAAAEGSKSSTSTVNGPTTSDSPSRTSSSDTSLTTQTYHVGSRTLYRDCPSSNDTVYTYGSSSSPMLFRKWCGMACWNVNGWFAQVNENTDSLDECINLCASYNTVLKGTNDIKNSSSANGAYCDSVCWRWEPNDPDFPGHCFGFKTVNVSGHFNVSQTGNSNCDSAGWMNPYS